MIGSSGRRKVEINVVEQERKTRRQTWIKRLGNRQRGSCRLLRIGHQYKHGNIGTHKILGQRGVHEIARPTVKAPARAEQMPLAEREIKEFVFVDITKMNIKSVIHML